jgi:pyruvate formate lyase activating enzyme
MALSEFATRTPGVLDLSPSECGWVHSWDTSVGVDGPGTRLVVFVSGCPLRCLYCENPDTWCRTDGTVTSILEIDALMNRYARFIAMAGGGFTVSGGEPLSQAEFVATMMRHAKERCLHTALDTSGYLGQFAGDDLLDDTDLVLLDLKAGSDRVHRGLTGRRLAPTHRFAERLAERGDRVWVRYVLVPGYTDDPTEVALTAEFAASLGCVERVDVLPFHKLGASKYEKLGKRFRLEDTPTPSPEMVKQVREGFEAFGLTAC